MRALDCAVFDNLETTTGRALRRSPARGSASPLDDLLTAVDIVCRSGDGRVCHEVNGQGGNVGRPDHAADRQSAAQLLATRSS